MCDLPTALATQVLTWEINGTLHHWERPLPRRQSPSLYPRTSRLDLGSGRSLGQNIPEPIALANAVKAIHALVEEYVKAQEFGVYPVIFNT